MTEEKTRLSVESYMTPMPLTVEDSLPIHQAHSFMQSNSIRHLPVINAAGELIGVVTDREVEVGRLYPGPGELLVRDIIAAPPLVVRPDTPLDEVVFEMMEHKHSCAVVEDESEALVGIFTEVDALRAFHELLGDIYTGKIAA